jgi:ferredoxin
VKIKVDRDLCQGHGVCRTEAPELFDVDREIEQVIVKDEQPPESLRAKVEAAVRYCPTRALAIDVE